MWEGKDHTLQYDSMCKSSLQSLKGLICYIKQDTSMEGKDEMMEEKQRERAAVWAVEEGRAEGWREAGDLGLGPSCPDPPMSPWSTPTSSSAHRGLGGDDL